ncbi:MAG TPA: response regulator [Candidatus Limnocylindrales bacterium]|nr:response regulator [Candidatus Limnocylindrales bacterium]
MSSILIIEDDTTLREMYAAKFTHEQFTVNTALDGREGIDKLRSLKPDIALLDLFMAKVSGFDVLKLVKNDPELNTIPILVLTNISVDVEDLLKNWGAKDFLLKANATPGDVVNKVNQLLKPAS